ncbi:transposase [Acidisoma sp.]|uniref:transposase n=1 Tax=Acidisoma sp. TaxID=1872115 RepID=UPI003B00BB2E
MEIVSRDRYGPYVEGARQGASQARHIADRFHLVKNLRERIEHQLSRLERPLRHRPLQCEDAGKAPQCAPRGNPQVAEYEHLIQSSQRRSLETVFTDVRALHAARKTAAQIVRELGLSRKRGVYRDHLAKCSTAAV